MRRISQIAGLQSFARDTAGAVPVGQGVMGSLGAIGCFSVVGLFGTPIPTVLGDSLLFSLAVACVAGIAVAAKWHGALSPDTEVQASTGISL